VADVNNGLYQKHAPTPPRGTYEPGVFDYRDIKKNCLGKFTRHWHDEAKCPWLFDAKSGIMISYDDPESIKLKAEYISDKTLGGVMFWELSADDSENTLLNALGAVLRKKK
jgi:chitinase